MMAGANPARTQQLLDRSIIRRRISREEKGKHQVKINKIFESKIVKVSCPSVLTYMFWVFERTVSLRRGFFCIPKTYFGREIKNYFLLPTKCLSGRVLDLR